MNERVEFYRNVVPVNPVRPINAELWSYEYRSFSITRANNEYMFWRIETADGGLPPTSLSSSFTNRHQAEAAIDNFLAIEARKQESR